MNLCVWRSSAGVVVDVAVVATRVVCWPCSCYVCIVIVCLDVKHCCVVAELLLRSHTIRADVVEVAVVKSVFLKSDGFAVSVCVCERMHAVS